MTPMSAFPSDDAPLSEWLRPLSAECESPRAVALFSGQQLPPRNKPAATKRKHRRKKVDKARVVQMRSDGYSIRDTATVLGVLPRTVVRALKEHDDK